MVDERIINTATQLRAAIINTQQKCFLCFGTLLSFIRDKEFSIDGDIDIGVIGDMSAVVTAFSTIFRPIHKIIDDSTGQILNMSFQYHQCPVSIDVFLWRKKDGYYYHCYDEVMENRGDGILSQYHFKGTPEGCFDVAPEVIKAFQEDIRYGRSMTDFGTWQKLLPQCPTEGIDLPTPWSYGWCFDTWYPEWATKRPQFGVSMSTHEFTVRSCAGIQWQRTPMVNAYDIIKMRERRKEKRKERQLEKLMLERQRELRREKRRINAEIKRQRNTLKGRFLWIIDKILNPIKGNFVWQG